MNGCEWMEKEWPQDAYHLYTDWSVLNINSIFVFYELNNGWLSHIETLKCTRETKIYSLNLHSISLEFNISMPTVKRTDFLFPYLNIHCVNILPLKGLQLVSYDPFHGILTIERKPNLRCPPNIFSLWLCFFRYKFIVSKCLRRQSSRF